MIGEESHLGVESFNAPGGEALESQLAGVLSPVANLGSSDLSLAYRLYADQVSLAGTQFANTDTISLADPKGTTFVRLTNISPLLDLAVNANTYLNLHAIVTVIQQITANAPLMPSNAQEPNDILPIEEALAELGFAAGEIPANNAGVIFGQSVDSIFANYLDDLL